MASTRSVSRPRFWGVISALKVCFGTSSGFFFPNGFTAGAFGAGIPKSNRFTGLTTTNFCRECEKECKELWLSGAILQ